MSTYSQSSASDRRHDVPAAAAERGGPPGPLPHRDGDGAATSSGRLTVTRRTHVGDAALAHAEWNWNIRGESEIQRLDRNFLELLQELRVAQTGVQILFAFLLGIVFTPRFVDLDEWQRVIYVLTLVLSAGAAAVLIAPVMYHRLVFRRRLKRRIVDVTHRHALVGLTLLLLSLVGALNLAVSLVLGPWAILVSAVLGSTFVAVWFGPPLVHRRRN